jgi:PAS domain S-box-containing protein
MERGLTRTRAVGGGEGARRPAKAAGTGRLPHELEVHQVELEAQKEELQRIRRELQESRDRFSELYDYAPIGYLTLDREGRITQVNLAAAELLRQPRDTLVGLELSSVVEATEADRLWIQRHAALVTRSKQSCDVHLRGPNGSVA